MTVVTVTAFEDLACGDCADYAYMLDMHLAPKYGRQVSFVHKDFPLDKHEWAYDAAVAARYIAGRSPAAAHRFRRFCMHERHRISKANLERHFERFTQESGVDAPCLTAVLSMDDLRSAVERDMAEGRALGVDKTPTVLAGEIRLVELFSLEEAVEAVEAALAAAGNPAR